MSGIPTRGAVSDETFAAAEAHMTEPTQLVVSQEAHEVTDAILAALHPSRPHEWPGAISAEVKRAMNQSFLAGLEKAAEVEAETVGKIATMMDEFVDNWPPHKKLDTSLKLIAKTFRALLDGTPETDLAACERAIDRMGWPEIHAFMGQPGQSPHEDAGGFLLRKIKTLFGIKPDKLETYREAARRLVDEARNNAKAIRSLSIEEGGA